MMPLQLLLIFIFTLLLLPPFLSTGLVAKPGCHVACGDLTIPYPFGVGSDCSFDPSFDITCNISTVSPKAYLSILNKEVIEINETYVRVKYPNLVSACYGMSGESYKNSSMSVNLTGTPYTLSYRNRLTAIGCDDMMMQSNGSWVSGGCSAFCAEKNDSGGVGYCAKNSSTFGNGCCQAYISGDGSTDLVGAELSDMSGNFKRRKLFPCSYAFIQEYETAFSYPLYYLDNSTAFQNDHWASATTAPVVRLDWTIIAAENCSRAQQNDSTYACKDSRSVCVDYGDEIRGYMCRCVPGYEGNPYLLEGCQDIDECDDNATNPCASNSICKNIVGSVMCLCPKGYVGDGRKDGSGCNQLPQTRPITILIIGLLCSALGLLLVLAVCFWLRNVLKRRKSKKRKENLFKQFLLQHQNNEETFSRTKLFPAKELEKATDHFNETRILGKGGEGIVYKGMLHDGTIVAIKKLNHVDENQVEQFINEVVILSQINHRNVIKLLGCCLATEVPLLVYEFLPNGTLYTLIQESSAEFPLSWNIRLKIAADVAGALAYLHSSSSIPIYHRDIKTSNILLDEKLVVKVADFGISKLVALDQTHLTTMKVKGTFGYFDPEYFQSRQYTGKSDVFSFGVVLAELLTGRKPIFRDIFEEMEIGLATHFLTSMEESSLHNILDPQVSEHCRKEEVIAVARLTQKCLNLMGKYRPTMKEVYAELESLRMSHMPEAIQEEF